jgi:hypothetical protein
MISTHGSGHPEPAISGDHRYGEASHRPTALLAHRIPEVYAPCFYLRDRPDTWPFETRGQQARAIRAEIGLRLAHARRVGR